MERTLITLILPPDRTPLGRETLWAERLGATSARLLNSSYLAPLALGDVVSVAERNNRVVITGFLASGPMTLSVTLVATDVITDEQRVMADRWNQVGAVWTEGARNVLATVWDPSVTPDDVFTIMTSAIRGRPGWCPPVVYSREERERRMRTLLQPAGGRAG